MFLRTIISTLHLSLMLLVIRDWMLAQVTAWEKAEKVLTESEKIFAHTAFLLAKYWYVLVCIWLMTSLLIFTASSMRAKRKSVTWV